MVIAVLQRLFSTLDIPLQHVFVRHGMVQSLPKTLPFSPTEMEKAGAKKHGKAENWQARE